MNPSPVAVSDGLHKLTPEYGDAVAKSLYTSYKDLAPTLAWENKETLDIGCHWGYLQKMLIETAGVKSAYGVDIHPRWEDVGKHNPNGTGKIRLLCGNVTKIEELQSMQFDLILSSGTMMTMPIPILEAVTTWIFDHLNPGGSALVNIRSFLSYWGGDFQSQFKENIHYAHLLFGKPAIEEALGEEVRYMVPYCAATWAMHFFRHGFEIVNMIRGSNPFPEIRDLHCQRLRHYEEEELATAQVKLWLRKPEVDSDVKKFLNGKTA